MADKFEKWARIVGAAGGIDESRWPGLALIFRQIAHDEREACAKIADVGMLVPPDGGSPTQDEINVAEGIAAAIRNRT